MIIISELGDKTFLIAALMAMSHPRGVVFSAAFASLLIMTVLSATLGHTVPHLSNPRSYRLVMLVPRRYAAIFAAVLFLVFGAKMLKDGLAMSRGTGSVQDEIKEVEQELQEKDFSVPTRTSSSPSLATTIPAEALEAGSSWRPRKADGLTTRLSASVINLMNLLFSPVFVQTFVMTFLGEWGDRSQIATITLAAASGTSPTV
jgi:Ca2+/H+ antiporter, TMEM165/GDT1 family